MCRCVRTEAVILLQVFQPRDSRAALRNGMYLKVVKVVQTTRLTRLTISPHRLLLASIVRVEKMPAY